MIETIFGFVMSIASSVFADLIKDMIKTQKKLLTELEVRNIVTSTIRSEGHFLMHTEMEMIVNRIISEINNLATEQSYLRVKPGKIEQVDIRTDSNEYEGNIARRLAELSKSVDERRKEGYVITGSSSEKPANKQKKSSQTIEWTKNVESNKNESTVSRLFSVMENRINERRFGA